MTQKRDTHVLQVVRAVRELQNVDLDFIDPKVEHAVSANQIAEKTGIDAQRLRPLLTTMHRQHQVFRIEGPVTVPRKSRSGQDSSITRKQNYYYVDARNHDADTTTQATDPVVAEAVKG